MLQSRVGFRRAHLFFATKADAIVTDDAAFVALLDHAGVRYLPPALVLVQLAQQGYLLELADLRAEDEQVDRSTALRQLLFSGAVAYVLDLLRRGRISLSRAAELLDCSTLAVVQKAQERGVVLGTTVEHYEKAKVPPRSKLR